MSTHFPSRDELTGMSIDHLHALRVEDMEDEKLLQEIIDAKSQTRPFVPQVNNLDVQEAEIKTPEEEAKYQAIIDERLRKAKVSAFGEETVLQGEVSALEAEKETLEKELPYEMPVEPLELTPEAPVVESEVSAPIENQEVSESVSDVKCELCGSKGFRHKKGCPTLSEK